LTARDESPCDEAGDQADDDETNDGSEDATPLCWIGWGRIAGQLAADGVLKVRRVEVATEVLHGVKDDRGARFGEFLF
jgi:hypothetical protein